MSYLVRPDSLNTIRVVEARLKVYLVDKVASEPFVSEIAPSTSKVEVVQGDVDAHAMSSGPYVQFRRTAHDDGMWRKRLNGVEKKGRRHFFTYAIDACANPFSGSTVGEANKESSDTLLVNLLDNIFNDDEAKAELVNLCIEEVKCVADSEADQDLTRINPHKLTFVVHAITDPLD